jgi:saccharopine dehydrogenase (NAD+, L-lysine-forming)
MSDQTFVVLGGYGNTGRPLAQLLLQETDVRVVLAGRSIKKAQAAAAQLNSRYEGNRVSGTFADASDRASLPKAFTGVDLVIVASSTTKYAREVAVAALEADIDYLDIQISAKKIAELESLSGEIEKAGSCFITDGGFHPGLPAALVRYVAAYFDRLESANVGSVIKADWRSVSLSDSTICEFIELINDFQALVFRRGRWKKARMFGMMDYISMEFGGEFGRQYCVPMFLEEMRQIPEMYPSLSETGFFVGGFNWFVDWLVLPLAAILLRIFPVGAVQPMGRLMIWGLRAFSKPPYGTLLKVEARGVKNGKPKAMDVIVSHHDEYMLTAIPVAACLLQYLDGSIRAPGLWTQANVVEPNRFMEDMERMGVDIRVREKE